MYERELRERTAQVEMLDDEYQRKVIMFIDSVLDEAKSKRQDTKSCFGCLKDSPIQVDIEAMRGERVWC